MKPGCAACGHLYEDHHPDGACWNGSGCGNRCTCRYYIRHINIEDMDPLEGEWRRQAEARRTEDAK